MRFSPIPDRDLDTSPSQAGLYQGKVTLELTKWKDA
nr:MAG TPA: hypothetical protein [Caudoviricetes sp.]